jgi:hypothetical protein
MLRLVLLANLTYILKVMSILSVAAGNNARCHGVCCVAIGDNIIARGAYQVVQSDVLSLPELKPDIKSLNVWAEIKELKLTYTAMQEQKVAPGGFAERACEAINRLANEIEKRVGMSFEKLIEHVNNENKKIQEENTTLEEKKQELEKQIEKVSLTQ